MKVTKRPNKFYTDSFQVLIIMTLLSMTKFKISFGSSLDKECLKFPGFSKRFIKIKQE